jgi:chromate transporter
VTLLELALYFGLLSLVAFGGMPSVLPEMQRYVVEAKSWTSAEEFIQLFALAQAAPGPNVLIVGLIGWRVAGLAGAVVALLATCASSGAVAWFLTDLWERFKDAPWRIAMQRAIAPLVVGLILSSGFILATPASPDWRLWLIAGASAAAALATRLNPLWMLAGGGVLGALLLP